MTDTRTHILLIEDDLNLGIVLFDQLKYHGFKVNWERNGKDGLQKFFQINPDICVVDLMMPEMDGLTFIKKLREENKATPVIVATAKSNIEDKSESFGSGADDFISKPFEIEELILRINARLKQKPSSDTPTVEELVIGSAQLFPDTRKIKFPNEEVKLSERECSLLKILIENQGNPVKRNIILETFWGEDNPKNSRSLDVFLSRIRKYLTHDPSIQIENIHGVGYVMSCKS